MDLLLETDILFGEVKSPEHLLDDAHLKATGIFPMIEHPTPGRVRPLGFPVSFTVSPCKLRRYPPELGQDNDDIFLEIGLSP